ncbi:hypothetical protein [Caldimonas brevitalea]|uniref:hypothetical protein n=1 Tax=Caldimonas brevitalea TaxID=413882 RepID=UPI0012FA13BB|nr:hypothetical protein [Caldimonas brevitalea]
MLKQSQDAPPQLYAKTPSFVSRFFIADGTPVCPNKNNPHESSGIGLADLD